MSTWTKTSTMVCLVLIVAVAAWLRVTAATDTTVLFPIRADAADYTFYALNLRHHGVYSRQNPFETESPQPDAVRSPGYPLFLVPFFDALDTAEVQRVQLAQALLGTATVLLAFLFLSAFLPAGLALVGTLLTALSPHLINISVYVLTETLFALLLVGGLWLLTLAHRRRQVALWLMAGVILAASALVRPSMQYFMLALPVLLYIHNRRAQALRPSLLFAAGFLALYLWWPLRNLLTLGFASDPQLLINFLHHGLYPNFMYQADAATFGYPYRHDPASPELSASVGGALKGIWDRVTDDPEMYLHWYLAGKPIAFWSWNMVNCAGGIFVSEVLTTPFVDNRLFESVYVLMKHTHVAVLGLSLFAAVMIWTPGMREHMEESRLFAARLCVFVLIYFTGLHMIGAPFPRYAIPLRPSLYGAACLALYLFYLLATNRRRIRNEYR